MAGYDPRVGDVQVFLRSVLENQCVLQGLPKCLLFLGKVEKTSGFFGNTGLRVLYINRDETLEEQLETLWHEIFHLEVDCHCFGESIYLIQNWWDRQTPALYRACHRIELCLHEQYADSHAKLQGQDLRIDNAKCNDILFRLRSWENDPELIFRLWPSLRQFEWFVQLVEENFRVRL